MVGVDYRRILFFKTIYLIIDYSYQNPFVDFVYFLATKPIIKNNYSPKKIVKLVKIGDKIFHTSITAKTKYRRYSSLKKFVNIGVNSFCVLSASRGKQNQLSKINTFLV